MQIRIYSSNNPLFSAHFELSLACQSLFLHGVVFVLPGISGIIIATVPPKLIINLKILTEWYLVMTVC